MFLNRQVLAPGHNTNIQTFWEKTITHTRNHGLTTRLRLHRHELKIERDRYKKPYVERSQRICGKCSSNQTEDELHFIINSIIH